MDEESDSTPETPTRRQQFILESTGHNVQVLVGHTSDVNCCDFSGSKMLVTASNDKLVRIWKMDDDGIFSESLDSAPISPLAGHRYGVNCARFSPFGTIIATCSTDGFVILWNALTGEQVCKLEHPSGCAIRICCFSPSSALLASGGDDETLTLWDISTRTMIRTLEGHEAMITTCAFTPDSSYLVSGSTAGDLKVWDARYGHGKEILTMTEAHDMGVLGCDLSSQYQINSSNGPLESYYVLASCGNDDLIKLWHVRGGFRPSITLSHTLVGHSGNVNNCRFSIDGSLLASAAGDKSVILWDPLSGNLLHRLEGHNRYVTSCAFSVNNRLLATGSNDKTVILWPLDQIHEKYFIADGKAKDITGVIYGDPIDGENNGRGAVSVSSAITVSQWNENDVNKWLEKIGLDEYCEAFAENKIDGSELLHLTHDTLITALKIKPLGHRSKILRCIQSLRNPLWQHIALSSDDNITIPEELYCPITHEVMHDPVIASDGYSYERLAITEWFANDNNTSPMTNEQLVNQELMANMTLKLLINKYL